MPESHPNLTDLISKQHLLQHPVGGGDSGLSSGVEGMKFDLAGDELRRHFRVGGCSGTATVDIWGDVMDLRTVLVRHNVPVCRASISPQNKGVCKDTIRKRQT